MKSSKTVIHSALAGVLALGALTTASQGIAAEGDGMEKCAGVIKAGHNDCATSKNACHSHVTTDSNPEAWIFVPKGTCDKIAGAHVTVAANTIPAPKK